jgi:hypothetical protein
MSKLALMTRYSCERIRQSAYIKKTYFKPCLSIQFSYSISQTLKIFCKINISDKQGRKKKKKKKKFSFF